MGTLGRWITNNTEAPFLARRVFTVRKPIEHANLEICGLGQFILSINGARVGDHELDPGWTDYRKVIEYVTFDVSDCLVQGKNCIAAEVGNGWYIMNREHYTFAFPAFMPPNPNPYQPFGESLVAAFVLRVGYPDGTEPGETEPETADGAAPPEI